LAVSRTGFRGLAFIAMQCFVDSGNDVVVRLRVRVRWDMFINIPIGVAEGRREFEVMVERRLEW